MCDTRPVVLAVALLVALPCAAQRPPSDTVLRARVDSLAQELERAEATLDSALAADRLRRFATGTGALDTQSVGPVIVVSLRDDAGTARTSVERALDQLGELGREGASPLEGFTLLVADGRTVPALTEMRGPDAELVWLPPFTRSDRRVNAAVRPLLNRLTKALPADVQAWLGGAIAVDAHDAALTDVYRSLAVASSRAAGGCSAGDIGACAGALGLSDPGPAWENWYTRAQLAAWASANAPRGYVSVEGEAEAFDACYYDGDAAACEFAAAHGRTPPTPLSPQARATLVGLALERGGTAGYARLRTDTEGPVLDRLARAAGTSPDALLREWRERVMDARPVASADLGGTLVVTILWTLAVSAIAMRSKRWRLG